MISGRTKTWHGLTQMPLDSYRVFAADGLDDPPASITEIKGRVLAHLGVPELSRAIG